jgi:transposase
MDHGAVNLVSTRGSFRKSLLPSDHDPGSGPAQPKETILRFYNQPHRFYAGIDLHARTMHVCILDSAGSTVYDRNLPCHFETLLQALAPFRDDLVIGAECVFGWYWLADRCAEHEIPFVLDHALYLKLIHGAKARNDKIDAGQIARWLRGANFPLAYVYPNGMRETRDLLRRRMYLVHKRAELITHLEILNAQNNRPEARLRRPSRRTQPPPTLHRSLGADECHARSRLDRQARRAVG